MKYIPMLFSTPMVQQLLAGNKTMTRRIVKPQPVYTPNIVSDHLGNLFVESRNSPTVVETRLWNMPQLGDVIWVRETFIKIDIDEEFQGRRSEFAYKASFEDAEAKYGSIKKGNNKRFIDSWKWKPSIHMPKSACRLFLKVKDVRVERLKDISEEDAIAEGVLFDVDLPVANFQTKRLYHDYTGSTVGCADARSSFMTLWQSINGKDSWDANPWVWVVQFERVERPADFT